jgi:hypothetical protein
MGATLLRRLLDLEPLPDTGVVLSSLIVGALLWAYHAYVLIEDSRAAPNVEAQVNIRRVYWYLVASVGLLALLIGLGSIISVIINALGGPLGITESLREQLAWSVAGLVSGLVVWLLPWRNSQREVDLPDAQGFMARSAAARRIYLFGFVLMATLTFLFCAIFLVYALLSFLLGVGADFGFSEIAHALAFAIMATAVWVYHGSILRRDNDILQDAMTPFGAEPRIVLIDDRDGRLGRSLGKALAAALPEAHLDRIALSPEARALLVQEPQQRSDHDLLQAADIIVAPWTAVTPHAGRDMEEGDIFEAVAGSPAHKLLIPTPREGWDWSGVESWREETAVRQTVQGVKQIVAGEAVRLRKPFGIGRLLLTVAGVLLLILFLFTMISIVLSF